MLLFRGRVVTSWTSAWKRIPTNVWLFGNCWSTTFSKNIRTNRVKRTKWWVFELPRPCLIINAYILRYLARRVPKSVTNTINTHEFFVSQDAILFSNSFTRIFLNGWCMSCVSCMELVIFLISRLKFYLVEIGSDSLITVGRNSFFRGTAVIAFLR